MPGIARALALTSAIFLLAAPPALAQKTGGVLKFFHRDSPASGSIHEEATISAVAPFMGVFNNLVLFNQNEKQNRLDLIEPELAESWKWNEEYTRLSFQLRQGVKWHDGKPFTAARRQMHLGHAARQVDREAPAQPAQGLVSQPRRGHDRRRLRGELCAEASAAGISDAARKRHVAGLSVPRAGARHAHAIRSAPARSNSSNSSPTNTSSFAKNPDYWKPGRPYLDGIEWTIIPNRSTQTLAFIAGKFDMTFPYEVTVQSMRDIKSQAPDAICELTPTPVAINLLVNRDDAAVRRPGHPPGDAADDRPEELHRHHRRGPGRYQRRDAAAARRAVGSAAGNSANPAGLWPRCRRPTAPRRAS